MGEIADDIAYFFLNLGGINLKEGNEFVEKLLGVEYLIDLCKSPHTNIGYDPANFSFNRSSGVV